MYNRLSFRLIYLRSFCTSSNSSKTDKLNKLRDKLNQDKSSANSPIGMMDRLPKKDEKIETKHNDEPHDYAPFPNNVNPKTGEVNGPKGPEPTRYGDWERKGRCSDF